MKKKAIVLLLIVCILLGSCASTKRDCQGIKHYKTKGGFYL